METKEKRAIKGSLEAARVQNNAGRRRARPLLEFRIERFKRFDNARHNFTERLYRFDRLSVGYENGRLNVHTHFEAAAIVAFVGGCLLPCGRVEQAPLPNDQHLRKV